MVSTTRLSAWFLVVVGAACVAGAPMANAQELRGLREKNHKICASYGPGFAAGDGAGHCVKVLERMRIEPSGRRSLSDFDPPMVYAPLQEEPLRGRVRVNGGFRGVAAH